MQPKRRITSRAPRTTSDCFKERHSIPFVGERVDDRVDYGIHVHKKIGRYKENGFSIGRKTLDTSEQFDVIVDRNYSARCE